MYVLRRSAFRGFAAAAALALAVAGGGCTHTKHSSPTAVDIDPDFGSNDPSVVVAIGDSITFGVLDTNVPGCGGSYRGLGGFCPILQSLTGKTVINEGVCGEESFDGVDRINDVLRRWRPGVILIDYGVNDLFYPTNSVIDNLRIMVDAARRNHTVPILGTLVPAARGYAWLNPDIERVNAQIRALCAEQGLECADHYAAFESDPRFRSDSEALTSDDLHPNHEGYVLMAKTWRWPLLRAY
jgi:lysophospholipase L1-like esterase